jgi:hypothetical protein
LQFGDAIVAASRINIEFVLRIHDIKRRIKGMVSSLIHLPSDKYTPQLDEFVASDAVMYTEASATVTGNGETYQINIESVLEKYEPIQLIFSAKYGLMSGGNDADGKLCESDDAGKLCESDDFRTLWDSDDGDLVTSYPMSCE